MYKLGWFGYFLGCYKKCLKFSGRASRTEYWSFQLFKWMTYILVVVFIDEKYSPSVLGTLIILNILPDIAVCIRRLHDTDVSSKQWVYFVLIPLYTVNTKSNIQRDFYIRYYCFLCNCSSG